MQLSKFKDNIVRPNIEQYEIESGDSSPEGKTILLIDDEPMVTDICEMMIKRLGHKVLKAHSGSEGIELFMASKTRIDLIISDFNMPGMKGQEVVNMLRIMGHGVKVLLSSGGMSAAAEDEVIINGFNGFLKKPYSMATLSNKIAEILN
jgi:two-component system cell cycle sensor histidine kinase/response regulator CckA